MVDFVGNLHFLNMVLVLLTGSVTTIWGFILYFSSNPQRNVAKISTKETPANTSPADEAENVEAPVEPLSAVLPAQIMNRPWRIALIVTAIVALIQGLLGLSLVLLGQKPGTGTDIYWLHYVYGGIVALVIPIAITYATSGKNVRRDILIFSLAALILVAAAVRALMTGPSPH